MENTNLTNDAIKRILDIISNFNNEGGIASPIEFITTMMYRQFMF